MEEKISEEIKPGYNIIKHSQLNTVQNSSLKQLLPPRRAHFHSYLVLQSLLMVALLWVYAFSSVWFHAFQFFKSQTQADLITSSSFWPQTPAYVVFVWFKIPISILVGFSTYIFPVECHAFESASAKHLCSEICLWEIQHTPTVYPFGWHLSLSDRSVASHGCEVTYRQNNEQNDYQAYQHLYCSVPPKPLRSRQVSSPVHALMNRGAEGLWIARNTKGALTLLNVLYRKKFNSNV